MTERLLSKTIDNEALSINIKGIKNDIKIAAEQSGRRYEDITLVAATKTVSSKSIIDAINLGILNIGENRVQEFTCKEEEIRNKGAKIHFIGHLQKNKVKFIVGKVDMIQSVDTMGLAEEISKQSVKKNVNTDILLEVNIGKEKSKFGFKAEDLCNELSKISKLKGVTVRGLMAIVPICDKEENTTKYFKRMYNLFVDMSGKKQHNVNMDYLSMGMSSDYMEAIRCGANMVRIGTSIFGNRK